MKLTKFCLVCLLTFLTFNSISQEKPNFKSASGTTVLGYFTDDSIWIAGDSKLIIHDYSTGKSKTTVTKKILQFGNNFMVVSGESEITFGRDTVNAFRIFNRISQRNIDFYSSVQTFLDLFFQPYVKMKQAHIKSANLKFPTYDSIIFSYGFFSREKGTIKGMSIVGNAKTLSSGEVQISPAVHNLQKFSLYFFGQHPLPDNPNTKQSGQTTTIRLILVEMIRQLIKVYPSKIGPPILTVIVPKVGNPIWKSFQ